MLSAFCLSKETFQGTYLLSVSERFVTATKIILERSLFYQFMKVLVEMIMFAFKTYCILGRRDLLSIFIFIFLFIIPVSLFFNSHPRYFYLIYLFII